MEENLSSGKIWFEPISDPIVPGIELVFDANSGELGNSFPSTPGAKLANQVNFETAILNAYTEDNIYNIIYEGTDLVGNVGLDTMKNVTFDKIAPTAEITYYTQYITSLSPKAGTLIQATFDEPQVSAPKLNLYYLSLIHI